MASYSAELKITKPVKCHLAILHSDCWSVKCVPMPWKGKHELW